MPLFVLFLGGLVKGLGGIAGSVFGGPLGGAIGAGLGGALGGLFAGKKTGEANKLLQQQAALQRQQELGRSGTRGAFFDLLQRGVAPTSLGGVFQTSRNPFARREGSQSTARLPSFGRGALSQFGQLSRQAFDTANPRQPRQRTPSIVEGLRMGRQGSLSRLFGGGGGIFSNVVRAAQQGRGGGGGGGSSRGTMFDVRRGG